MILNKTISCTVRLCYFIDLLLALPMIKCSGKRLGGGQGMGEKVVGICSWGKATHLRMGENIPFPSFQQSNEFFHSCISII